MVVQLDRGRNGALVVVVLVDADDTVQARGRDLLVRQPLSGLQAGDAAAVVGRAGGGQDIAREVPDAQKAIVAGREDALLATGDAVGGPCAGGAGLGEDIDSGDPVVVLKGGDVQRRDQGTGVFNVQRRFGGDAILCEEVVDRGAEELAVDEEFEGNRLFGVQEGVDEFREVDTAQGFTLSLVFMSPDL